jgi:hypothetical protein
MNAERLNSELLEFGYTGRISDLIKYSGSVEALTWYWESYLGKVLKKSKNFYGGGFIRFKVKEEANKKYRQFCCNSKILYKAEMKDNQKRQLIREKQKEFSETLKKWFVNYEKNTNKDQQLDDLKKFVESSGYFDYMDYVQKNELISLKSPVNLNDLKKILFYNYRNSMLIF